MKKRSGSCFKNVENCFPDSLKNRRGTISAKNFPPKIGKKDACSFLGIRRERMAKTAPTYLSLDQTSKQWYVMHTDITGFKELQILES